MTSASFNRTNIKTSVSQRLNILCIMSKIREFSITALFLRLCVWVLPFYSHRIILQRGEVWSHKTMLTLYFLLKGLYHTRRVSSYWVSIFTSFHDFWIEYWSCSDCGNLKTKLLLKHIYVQISRQLIEVQWLRYYINPCVPGILNFNPWKTDLLY